MSSPEQEHPQFVVRSSGVREINPSPEPQKPVKTMLFIDGFNLLGAFDSIRTEKDSRLSFDKLFALISHNGADSMAINYYANNADLPEEFLQFLVRNGVRIVASPGKDMRDKKKKGPLDTVIVTDLLDRVDLYEEAVLISGDGDFAYTIEQLIQKGKKVTVISAWKTLGRELPASGARIVLLEELLPEISYIRTRGSAHLRAV